MAAWHCGSKTYLQYWVGKHYVAWWLLQPPEKRYEHLLVHRIAPDTMKNKTIFQTTTFSTFGSALLWSAKAALFTTKRYGSPGEIVILTGNSSRSISLDCLLYGLVGKMHPSTNLHKSCYRPRNCQVSSVHGYHLAARTHIATWHRTPSVAKHFLQDLGEPPLSLLERDRAQLPERKGGTIFPSSRLTGPTSPLAHTKSVKSST